MKTIYFAMTTHPNMNYDRSLRSVIWEQFPKLYRLYLTYLRDHPTLKSHMQLPPQTLLSLKQCAPDVIELAQAIRAEGRLKFMGTYFSESIAQCQDGMSVLDAAELGCAIASRELDAELEGFFLQEIAYTPQLPYVIDKLGVGWTIVRDWEENLKPFWAVGLDGTRCVAVPLIEAAQRERVREDPESLPDNALLITHCDMEIPHTLREMHDLERYLRDDCGYETKWCFVSDYIAEVGVTGEKHLTPCTNKPQGTTASPSFSRWCSDPLSIGVHATTLGAMAARRAASLAAYAQPPPSWQGIALPRARPATPWEVENPWIYPELVAEFGTAGDSNTNLFRCMAMLIAWGSNSDARGWYPMLERRFERLDSFHEVTTLADAVIRAATPPAPDAAAGPGLLALNPHGVDTGTWLTLYAPEPIALRDAAGTDAVALVRRDGDRWEHLVRLALPPYTLHSYRKTPSSRAPEVAQPGDNIAQGDLTATFADGTLTLTTGAGPELTLALDPFSIAVKSLDRQLRAPRPEGDWRVLVIPGVFPRLIASRQIDYHIHFRAEYVLDAGRLVADWRFYFTYPTLVDSLDDFDAGGPKVDFEPGGLCATLTTGAPGEVWYDVPFGIVRHPNPHPSFIPPLTHAFVARETGGAALISCDGAQSFKAHAAAGRVGLCMGKSTTSGGRRKLLHWAGDDIGDFGCDTEWYKEPFYGELRHRFVVQPFAGDWHAAVLPIRCRALALGPHTVESLSVPAKTPVSGVRLAELTPANVRLAGIEPDTGRIVLNEMCGQETDYRLRLGDVERHGRIGPFGIVEIK